MVTLASHNFSCVLSSTVCHVTWVQFAFDPTDEWITAQELKAAPLDMQPIVAASAVPVRYAKEGWSLQGGGQRRSTHSPFRLWLCGPGFRLRAAACSPSPSLSYGEWLHGCKLAFPVLFHLTP